MRQGVRFAHRNIHLSMDKSPPWPVGPIQKEMKGDHAHLRWAIAWAKPTRVSRSYSIDSNQLKFPKKKQFCRWERPKINWNFQKNQFCRWERTKNQLKIPKYVNFAGERDLHNLAFFQAWSILQVREKLSALDHRADITDPNLRLTAKRKRR